MVNIVFPLGVEHLPVNFVLFTEGEEGDISLNLAMEALTQTITAAYLGEINQG